jgi:hypothetical protein
MTFVGTGEGTSRRQPRPASSPTIQPKSRSRRFASASERNGPTGFAGAWKAGSLGSTTTWVTTVTTKRRSPFRLRLLSSSCCR